MKAKWKLVKFILGITVFIFLVSFSAKRHACKPIKDIRVSIKSSSSQYFINDSLVKRVVNAKPLQVLTIPLGNLNIAEIEQLLNQNSFIKQAQVHKGVEGNLNIKVIQKTPVCRIITENDEYYLSEDLSKMPLSTLYAAEVLMVGGDVEKEDFQGLANLVKYLNDDKLLKKHIIAVRKEAPNSFILLINKGDYVIEFGELDKIDEKFDKLKLFYEQYISKVGLDYYEKIDLRFNNQIVATKRIKDEK